MTQQEVLTILRKNDPFRSYFVSSSSWLHKGDVEPVPTGFDVSVLPGFDGTPCQIFQDKSYEECIKQIQFYYPEISDLY